MPSDKPVDVEPVVALEFANSLLERRIKLIGIEWIGTITVINRQETLTQPDHVPAFRTRPEGECPAATNGEDDEDAADAGESEGGDEDESLATPRECGEEYDPVCGVQISAYWPNHMSVTLATGCVTVTPAIESSAVSPCMAVRTT